MASTSGSATARGELAVLRQARGPPPFALAGLWDRWVSGDGEVIESCAILTRAARPPVDAVHDRMPVVLEPPLWDRWLDASLVALAEVDALLKEALSTTPQLVVYPVSPHVNDPRHDDATCLDASEPAQRRLF